MKTKEVRGFSLLEVLVAFSILAVSLGVVMRILSGSLLNADVVHGRAQAIALAQSLLAEAGVVTALVPGESAGDVGKDLRWKMAIAPFNDEVPDTGLPQTLTAIGGLELWEIIVDVRWGDPVDDAKRSLVLSSLRVQPRTVP